MVKNHYGYGLRNDEAPYAHKIPPGGNWQSLPREEQEKFWPVCGVPSGGYGNGLRRRAWNEPAGTITTNPMAKLSCQLHPGEKENEVVTNHDVDKALLTDKAMAGLEERAARGFRDYHKIRVQDPDAPCCTITTTTDHTQFLRPMHIPEGEPNRVKPLLDSLPKLPDSGLTSVELFAGAGLMRLGVEHAGVTTIWANDFDKGACTAHLHNFGEGSIVQGDITDDAMQSQIPDADIFVGGPPCQDFSVAGAGAGEDGARGKLVWTYLKIIEQKQPKAFIFENVKGLVGKKHKATFESLCQKFVEIGYNVSHRVVSAWDFGVAQKRERVFIVGIRKDLGFTYEFPESEYLRTGYRPVLRDAIGDLPEPQQQPNGKHGAIHEGTLAHNERHKELGTGRGLRPQEWDEPSGVIDTHTGRGSTANIYPENHDPKPLSEKVGERYDQNGYEVWLKKHPASEQDKPANTILANFAKGAPYGLMYPEAEVAATAENHDGHLFDNVGNNPTWEHANRVAPWDQPAPTRTEKDRCDGIHPGPLNHDRMDISDKALAGYERRGAQGGFGYRVNDYEDPSPTIFGRIANEGKAFVHPETKPRPRRFTVRECLRIQSVPDSYVFPETMSLSAMYRCVGNGVASRVAYYLTDALVTQLKEPNQRMQPLI